MSFMKNKRFVNACLPQKIRKVETLFKSKTPFCNVRMKVLREEFILHLEKNW